MGSDQPTSGVLDAEKSAPSGEIARSREKMHAGAVDSRNPRERRVRTIDFFVEWQVERRITKGERRRIR